MKKLIFLLLALALIPAAAALTDNNGLTFSATSSSVDGIYNGFRIIPQQNISVYNVTLASGFSGTNVIILDSSWALVTGANATISGGIASFATAINLTKGTVYYLGAGKRGGSATTKYVPAYTPPVNGAALQWSDGYYGFKVGTAGTNGTPNTWNIQSIDYDNATGGGGGNATTYFALTAHDNVTSSSITTFNATINGTFYSTTNGTIQTNINQSSSLLVNISATASGYYLNSTYNTVWDLNTSSDYDIGIYPWTNFYAFDAYDNTSLTSFTIEYDGTNQTTLISVARMPVTTDTYNFTIYATNYIPLTYTGVTRNGSYNARPYQAVLNLNATEILSATAITGWTLREPTTGQTSYGDTPYLLLKAGSYNLTFNKTGWFNKIAEFTVTAQTNATDTMSDAYQYVVNVTAADNITGSPVTNFTINITSTIDGYSEEHTTTNGSAIIPWIGEENISLQLYDSTIADVNSSINTSDYTAAAIVNVTLRGVTTNSILFYFIDEVSNTLVNDRLITVYLTGSIISYNTTTSNGTLFYSLITPQTYAIQYSAENYTPRTYYYTLVNGSTTTLYLYMLSNATATTVRMRVLDQDLARVNEATILATKKNLTGTNYYTVEMCKTDTNGECLLSLEISTPTYKSSTIYDFIVQIGGETVGRTGDTQPSSTEQEIVVNLESNALTQFFNIGSIQFGLSKNNAAGSFTYTVSDAGGNVQQGCLYLQRRTGSLWTTINSSCTSSAAFTITDSLNSSLGDENRGVGTVFVDGEEKVLIVASIPGQNDSLGALVGTVLFMFALGLISVVLFRYGAFLPGVSLIIAGAVYFLVVRTFPGLLLPTTAIIGLFAVIIIVVSRLRREQ